MSKKDGLRLNLEELIASAGHGYVKTDRVPQGTIWCAQSIAWEIDKATSGGNTRVRLYIEKSTSDYQLDEQDVPNADWLYTRNEDDFLYEGERLVLHIDQAQASTKAKLTVTGYRLVEGG